MVLLCTPKWQGLKHQPTPTNDALALRFDKPGEIQRKTSLGYRHPTLQHCCRNANSNSVIYVSPKMLVTSHTEDGWVCCVMTSEHHCSVCYSCGQLSMPLLPVICDEVVPPACCPGPSEMATWKAVNRAPHVEKQPWRLRTDRKHISHNRAQN